MYDEVMLRAALWEEAVPNCRWKRVVCSYTNKRQCRRKVSGMSDVRNCSRCPDPSFPPSRSHNPTLVVSVEQFNDERRRMVGHTFVNKEGRGTRRLICTSRVLYAAWQCSTNPVWPPPKCENSLESDIPELGMHRSEVR